MRGEGGVSATLQTLLAQGSIIAVNLATGVLTARYLGPGGRGEMSALTIWPLFLGGLVTFGMPSALTYNFRRHPEKQSQLFGTALLSSLVIGLLVAIVGALVIPYWMEQYPLHIIRAAQLLMLSSPIVLMNAICEPVLEVRDEFFIANALRFAIPVLTLLTLLGLAFTETMTPVRAALAYVAAGVVIFWPLTHLWRRLQPNLDDLRTSVALLLRYGVRSWGINVLGTLSAHLDRALVVGILAPGAMGVYVVALSAAGALSVVRNAIQAVLFPKAASRPLREVISMTGRAVRFNVVLTAMGAGALFLTGPFLLRVVYGPDFVEGAVVLRILAAEVFFSSTTMVLAQAFMAIDRPGVVTTTQGIGVLLSIPLLAILVPKYGLTGAGIALLISAVIRFAAVLACFPLLLNEKPPSLLLTADDVRSLRSLVQ